MQNQVKAVNLCAARAASYTCAPSPPTAASDHPAGRRRLVRTGLTVREPRGRQRPSARRGGSLMHVLAGARAPRPGDGAWARPLKRLTAVKAYAILHQPCPGDGAALLQARVAETGRPGWAGLPSQAAETGGPGWTWCFSSAGPPRPAGRRSGRGRRVAESGGIAVRPPISKSLTGGSVATTEVGVPASAGTCPRQQLPAAGGVARWLAAAAAARTRGGGLCASLVCRLYCRAAPGRKAGRPGPGSCRSSGLCYADSDSETRSRRDGIAAPEGRTGPPSGGATGCLPTLTSTTTCPRCGTAADRRRTARDGSAGPDPVLSESRSPGAASHRPQLHRVELASARCLWRRTGSPDSDPEFLRCSRNQIFTEDDSKQAPAG